MSAAIIWEACGRDPDALEFEHLPSFEVDVVRRWPATEKAKRVLGFEATTTLEDMLDEVIPWIQQAMKDGTI